MMGGDAGRIEQAVRPKTSLSERGFHPLNGLKRERKLKGQSIRECPSPPREVAIILDR